MHATYDGSPFVMSDGLSQWKILSSNDTQPSVGWNRAGAFDETGWSAVQGNMVCTNQNRWGGVRSMFVQKGGCPQW